MASFSITEIKSALHLAQTRDKENIQIAYHTLKGAGLDLGETYRKRASRYQSRAKAMLAQYVAEASRCAIIQRILKAYMRYPESVQEKLQELVNYLIDFPAQILEKEGVAFADALDFLWGDFIAFRWDVTKSITKPARRYRHAPESIEVLRMRAVLAALGTESDAIKVFNRLRWLLMGTTIFSELRGLRNNTVWHSMIE